MRRASACWLDSAMVFADGRSRWMAGSFEGGFLGDVICLCMYSCTGAEEGFCIQSLVGLWLCPPPKKGKLYKFSETLDAS